MKYLDFSDKEDIIRAFRARKEPLTYRGQKIMLFNDYSAVITKKRRGFSEICTSLFQRKIRFQLLYPAVLKVKCADGVYRNFNNASDAVAFFSQGPYLKESEDPGEKGRRGSQSPQSGSQGTSRDKSQRKNEGFHFASGNQRKQRK